MCGLFLAADLTFASLALGSIIVVAVAVLGSLTVLPALLMLLGKAHRPAARAGAVAVDDARPRTAAVAGAAAPVTHPAGPHAADLGARAARAGRARARASRWHRTARSRCPSSIAEKQSYDRLNAAFPNHQTSSTIVVKAPAAQAAAVTARLAALAGRLAHDPHFVGQPRLRASHDGTVHVLEVDAPFDGEAAAAKAGVQRTALDARAGGRARHPRRAVGGRRRDGEQHRRRSARLGPAAVGDRVRRRC